ncbi:hypothetical protein XPA_009435 [Xanthoria parietina]
MPPLMGHNPSASARPSDTYVVIRKILLVLAEAILLVPRDGSWTKPTSASNSSSKNEAAAAAEGARNTAQGRKRLRPRYATCRNCEEEFDVTQNGSEDCVYHPEETEVDYDAATWVDHDEDCHGTIDSEEMRREFPEAFIYPCCENIHDSSKKTRY